MFIAALIVAFVLGVVITLLAQLWISHRWLSYQPQLYPPYKQQHEKAELPPVLRQSVYGIKRQHGSRGDLGRGAVVGTKSIAEERRTSKTVIDDRRASKVVPDEKTAAVTDERKQDQNLILNVLFQFLFAELKDTARVRRWAARKMNAEFDEMLTSTAGKLMNQIQVRDFNFGSSFPLVDSVKLRHVELSNDEDIIQTVDVELDIDYEGGFQLTLDVDIIFGAWAYLSISVTKLAGQGRLQLTRVPFTHWSFSFYEEPRMEFNVDSRFNGRPIPQISSLIVNQIKRTIRKKHVLPSYKMRYKPLFVKPEESFINPDICFHGHKLGPGKLSVKVLKCSRLQELSSECKLYCTLSVDKEEIEEVWKQSWVTLEMTMKILPNSALGLNLKDQLSGDKTEKKRVVVDSIILDSPAAEAGLQRGDIVETIGNVRVLSIKHAMKQLKNSTENVIIRVKRHSSLALDRGLYIVQQDDIEIEESDMNGELQDDIGDFVSIDFKNKRSSSLNTDIQPSQPNQESVKFSEKLTKKIQSGKKKILGLKDNDKDKESVNKDRDSDTKSITTEEESAGDKNVSESISTPNHLRDGSQSAKSSPQKQVIEINRQRAHSDTSLNKVQLGDGDTGSACSDAGSYSKPELQHRIGEVNTRDVPFSPDPEWNEEFEFDCKEEDQYVNVCVWCKIAQTERASKNMSTTNKTEGQQQKNTPPTDDLPSYNVTTKIGYVSVPLSDITAGCLLTIQGDTQYTMYLHPPEETITASRTKLPYSGHIGYDKSICHGDITLSFVHKPFKTVEPNVRKETVKDVLNPPIHKLRAQSLEREQLDGQHRFRSCQFTSKTICHFCGKKIWLKGGLKCTLCRMVCHKKCVEKCNIQTKCS
ncbi:PDZ domain-containing protein 8-like, partial [Ruditapes philippinarum]|uniref:PDZ domain-containing protein 8-like n=1 Tax=Ruditapes philippinarum TaxID=129788 RepID=UPI00295A5963